MVKYISCRKKPKKVFIRHNIGIKQGISRGICFCCCSAWGCACPKRSVVSKSGNPGPGPVPNSYFLYYIFIKALILIKFEHNA